jgi:hypothetical protein
MTTIVTRDLGATAINGPLTNSQVDQNFINLNTDKAEKGANSDITSLSGLTTAISVLQGGTGSTTAPGALVALGERTSATGTKTLPSGTTAQRTDVVGIRFNTELNQYEGYNGTSWGSIGGGATGAPGNSVFVENDTTVTGNYTITAGKNAMSAGPISVDSDVTITIPSGSVWTII